MNSFTKRSNRFMPWDISKPSYQEPDEVIQDKQLDSYSAGAEDPPGNVLLGMEGHFSFFPFIVSSPPRDNRNIAEFFPSGPVVKTIGGPSLKHTSPAAPAARGGPDTVPIPPVYVFMLRRRVLAGKNDPKNLNQVGKLKKRAH